MKSCKKCGEEKPLSGFHRDRKGKDGYVSRCKDCIKLKSHSWYEANKDRVKKRVSEYSKENPEKVKIWRAKYRNSEKGKEYTRWHRRKSYAEAPEKFRAASKIYRDNNPDKRCHWQQVREARKKQSCPNWLTKEQMADIKSMYELRNTFSKTFGLDYHVDHIVPLQGKNVCGLHVPWNLQILEASLNLRKSNKEDFYRLRDYTLGNT